MADPTFEQICLDHYYRTSDDLCIQPSSDVDRVTRCGEDFAVLRNCNGVLAAYRAVMRGKTWTGEVQPVEDAHILHALDTMCW